MNFADAPDLIIESRVDPPFSYGGAGSRFARIKVAPPLQGGAQVPLMPYLGKGDVVKDEYESWTVLTAKVGYEPTRGAVPCHYFYEYLCVGGEREV